MPTPRTVTTEPLTLTDLLSTKTCRGCYLERSIMADCAGPGDTYPHGCPEKYIQVKDVLAQLPGLAEAMRAGAALLTHQARYGAGDREEMERMNDQAKLLREFAGAGGDDDQ